LVGVVRTNSQFFLHSAWTPLSFLVLAGVVALAGLLWVLSRRWQPWYLRFFLLLAFVTAITPALEEKWHMHFVPQAGRYKVELELTLVLLIVFGAAVLVDRLPRLAQVLLAVALLWPAYHRIVSHRQFSKNVIQSVDMTQTVEYQVAR